MVKHFFVSIIAVCVLCLTVLPASAGDSIEKKFKAYPNPIDRGALLKVELPDGHGELTVILYNTVGKAIQTLKTSNKTVEFHAPDVSGIYLLRVVEKQKVIVVEKIVVKE